MVVHTPNPVSGQEMRTLIEKLIEENKKILSHNDTNVLTNMIKKFSTVYGDAIDPIKLKTFIERYDTTFNIYWQMLEDAAEYRVEVYKHISGIWYKLTEINADRQNGYVAIIDLVGDGYVFRVVAEDRSGNILSRSEGMVIGYDRGQTKGVWDSNEGTVQTQLKAFAERSKQTVSKANADMLNGTTKLIYSRARQMGYAVEEVKKGKDVQLVLVRLQ